MAGRTLLSFIIFVSSCLFSTEVTLAARHLQQSTPITGGGSAIPGLPSFSFPTIPTLPSSLPSIPPMPSMTAIPSIPTLPNMPSIPTIPQMPSIPQIPGVPRRKSDCPVLIGSV
ncbi:unnamed protein product [Victoria cruziana]